MVQKMSILICFLFFIWNVSAAVPPPGLDLLQECCPIFRSPFPGSRIGGTALCKNVYVKDLVGKGKLEVSDDRCVVYHECRTHADCGCGKKCCYSGGIQGLPFKCIKPVPCRFGRK